MRQTDTRLAARLAARAGELLLELRATSGLVGKQLGARGDADANAYLLRELASARSDDAVLSEEAADSPARLANRRVWIVDPLDGTREFAMPGRSDWAVHVALWEAGRGITAAAVAQPALGAVYASDDVRTVHVERQRPVIVVSDSRPPGFAPAVAATLGAELLRMGSAGAKAMAVVRGDADAYLHAGGQWEWDSAAPVGVAQAAGLTASRISGAALEYNQPHPYVPDLLVCRPELAQQLIQTIAE